MEEITLLTSFYRIGPELAMQHPHFSCKTLLGHIIKQEKPILHVTAIIWYYCILYQATDRGCFQDMLDLCFNSVITDRVAISCCDGL